MGLDLDAQEISALVAECDTNRDGVIDLNEMEKVVRHYRRGSK